MDIITKYQQHLANLDLMQRFTTVLYSIDKEIMEQAQYISPGQDQQVDKYIDQLPHNYNNKGLLQFKKLVSFKKVSK